MTTFNTTLTNIFFCPISLETLTDPVIAQCGHSFERSQIDGWIARAVQEGSVPNCPLCRKPLSDLIPNLLIKDALNVLALPDNKNFTRIEDLTDEERDQVQAAIDNILAQRSRDEASGIPTRLEKPEKFLAKVAHSVSKFYCKN